MPTIQTIKHIESGRSGEVVFNGLLKLKSIWYRNAIAFIYQLVWQTSNTIYLMLTTFTAFIRSKLMLFLFDFFSLFQNFDANFRNNSMLQTSAIIAVCSIFVLLVILFSSLFLWK